ncbi:RNA methyltransferase [Cryptosporangium phraense]|uniref:RNA methyltransferase n=1 Tax=Cryptosporangium phraense TaxID=2593070 RepID=A0A545AJZ5_9ACTN|nr:RNA methyltransferase [Cryptosporangium phraense]
MPLASGRTPRVAASRQLTRRSRRDASRQFLAEGPQAVREALALPATSPGAPSVVFSTPAALARYAGFLSESPVPVIAVDDAGMAGLSETVTPQGLVAVCSFLDVPLSSIGGSLVAVLAEIQDPGNAGTVLRTADAAGASGVVFTDGSVDPYNGKCVRSSAGSLFHPPVVRGVPAAEAVASLQASGLQILAADGYGDSDLDDLADAGELSRPTAWLFGNEARGLPSELAALADRRVRIPIHGRAESLNLAAAAAVCLYASARAQRRLSSE